MVFERATSKCSRCPYLEKRRVWGTGPSSPLFCIIGEAPGKDEDAQGKPFVGMAGAMIHELLAAAGVPKSQVWFMNRLGCRPRGNDIQSIEARTAIECCEPGFKAEMKWLQERGVKVFVPVGNSALLALAIEPKITEYRGYVRPLPGGIIAIPTFHPAFIVRGQNKEKPTVVCDLAKAARIATDGWRKPVEQFNTRPTLAQVKAFAGSISSKTMVGVDIETTALRPQNGQIVVIGLASSRSTAISIPLLKQGGHRYWSPADEIEVRRLVQKIFAKGKLLFQNALFDVRWLIHDKFDIPDPVDDLLLLHHAIHPELPHSLRYIASVYTDVPHWKGVLRDRVGRITEMPDQELRTYNLRDAAVLPRAYPSLLADAEDLGVLSIYRQISLPLVRPILEMVDAGLLLDKRALTKVRDQLSSEAAALEQSIRSCLHLPPEWNPATPDHVRLLVYPGRPRQFDKALEELERYAENPKLRKDTKKYKEIRALADLAEIHTLYQPIDCTNRTTASGGSFSIDDDALLERRIAAERRREEVKGFKREKVIYTQEIQAIDALVTFLNLYKKWSVVRKILTTYTEYETEEDGCVHTSYLIHGTATGRLSSREPNLQNVPKSIRKVFKAPGGCKFVSKDYSNLELRVLAYVADDEVAIDMFEMGLNAHDENTRTMLGITKEDPQWEVKRAGIKMGRFARNYGGSLESIYRKLMLAVPDFGLSFTAYQAAENRYEKAHPAYVRWFKQTVREVLKQKRLTTCFGRLRIFLGDAHEIAREGPNQLIQSPAADIINKATIAIYKEFHKKQLKSRLCAQVHDELTAICPDSEVDEVSAIMDKHMQMQHLIGGRSVTFPVETRIGETWA